ncbi:GNAT family N-acetyltransferase [Vibrio sp. JPW-9-11-11]|uniref:GNAT family N-acetyltransferase n=1 Tax=Vibrio sp. JPW-9-11-11 TaxID=1416532 RepID=UPI001592B6ED|nr:GNAT family N-acetyltransferase [Vibrio sp. JPW-9-11-11]NVD08375.1 GNAT family N-acetyltransferase [Vibrio sp. JPW-9-11-11]
MEIIEYHSDYLFELAKIYSQVFSAPPWNEDWTEPEAVERLSHIASMNDGIGLIAILDGEVVGALLGFVYPYKGSKTCEIRELFVSNASSGNGIGKQLMAQLDLICTQGKIAKISLRTWKESSAFGFYEKCGFSTNESVVFLSKAIDCGK